MREELVARNVAKLVQVETSDYRVNRGLSVERARVLLTEARSTRWCAFYVLALYLSGCAVANCLGCMSWLGGR
jgi:hypothetical protein